MAQYTDRLARPSLAPLSKEDMEQLATQKAHELFAVCDTEQKGFITKRDMQRLQSELPLEPDQLEAVFDSLDDDKNGFLTLEEFTGGFGMFLGIKTDQGGMEDEADGGGLENVFEEDSQEEEKMFQNMMESMGANKVFDDDTPLKALWTKIHRDEPELMANFEDFLYKVTNDIQRSKIDFQSLETALRSKTNAHDEEIRKLYEEMEFQIKSEKERILTEEQLKERQMREAMEQELKEKDRQLQELLQKHQEMENRMKELNVTEAETKQENEKLMKERESLQDMLLKSEENLEESKAYISQLRNQQKDEKRERARAAIKLTENIALERESLVKQLDLLKDVNKKLRDDQDEAETRRVLEAEARSSPNKRKELCKQGSILGKYFPTNRGRFESTQESISEGEDNSDIKAENTKTNAHSVDDVDDLNDDDAIECDDDDNDDDIECDDDADNEYGNNLDDYVNTYSSSLIQHEKTENLGNREKLSSRKGEMHREIITESSRDDRTDAKLDNLTSSDGETDGKGSHGSRKPNQHKRQRKRVRKKEENKENLSPLGGKSSDGNVQHSTRPPYLEEIGLPTKVAVSSLGQDRGERFSPSSPRGQPVGAVKEEEPGVESTVAMRQRIFKVVFVGDSGVGKSSFIHRFCSDHFNPTFSATIGVDFQVKTLIMDGQIIVLQLWDTAGQERFRSITKQYFRKADGVIVMYDVTSETSFKNVRNWMTSVQEGVENGTALVVVGNKTDMCEGDDKRAVKTKEGQKLCLEYDGIFYETSAKTGSNVTECMDALAKVLKEKEDDEIEKSLHLEDPVKKKGCCGR